MQRVIFLTFVVIFVSCQSYEKEFYNNGKIKLKAEIDNDGLRHGKCKIFNESGSLIEELNFYKDNYHGMQVRYQLNGSISIITNYKYGIKDGKSYMYYENGNIMVKSFYINDKLEGDFFEYYENGQLKKEHKIINDTSVYFSEYDTIGNFIKENRIVQISTSNDTCYVGDVYKGKVFVLGPKYDSIQYAVSYPIKKGESKKGKKAFIIKDIVDGVAYFEFEDLKPGEFYYLGGVAIIKDKKRFANYKYNGSFIVLADSLKIGRVTQGDCSPFVP